MIDSSSLPCYVRIPSTEDVLLISSINTNCADIQYLHNGYWACSASDNPQLLITLAEISLYFPERLI